MRRLWHITTRSCAPVRSRTIADLHHLEGQATLPAVSLLFAAGERPRVRAVAALVEGGAGFSIGLTAPGGLAGSLELVASGLTFDLAGLAPEQEAALPPGFETQALEAIVLRPGPHLGGAAGMTSVWRTFASVAAQLTVLPGVRVVVWHPSDVSGTPEDFREAVAGWRDDGPVPSFLKAPVA